MVSGASIWYLDADMDGFGNSTFTMDACLQPAGFVADSSDCNDIDAAVNPDASEACDEIDNNCNGAIDDADAAIQYSAADYFYADTDGDGFGDANVSTQSCVQPVAHVEDNTDCDDTLADINPSTLWYADADGDGFGTVNFTTTSCVQPSGYLIDGTDCDDGNSAIYPGADEYCDSIDQDCDGDTNDPESLDLLTWHTDVDGDGYGDPASPVYACLQPAGTVDNEDDCSDVDALAFPFSHEPEIPNDGVDQDCDGYDVCRDLNCDAWPDIIFAAYDSGQSVDSSVYFGSVTGYDDSDSLTIAHRGTASSGTGDFNGDGYLDLVLNGYYGIGGYYAASTVYYGSSSGLDTSNTAEVFSYGSLESCVGDLNDDGFDDLVQSAHYDGNYYTDSTIFWGSAIGVSDSDRTSLYTNSPHDCEVEDLNQDGYLDIFFPAYGGYRSSYIYWGDANGVYDTNNRQDIAYLDYTRHANVEDVNSDGYPDLVFGSYYSNSGIYYGSATGYSTISFESYYQSGSYDSAVADLDGDGLLDIVSCQYLDGTSYSSTTSKIYWNTNQGYFDSYTTALETNSCRDVEIRDVNQDGYPDIFFLSYVSGSSSAYFYSTTSYLYYGSATGYSANNRSSIPSYGSQGIEISDLNYDGFPDLILGNRLNFAGLPLNDSVIYWGGSYGWGWSSTNLGARGIRKVELVGSWTD